jgi:DNA-binding NarL/FixJ family response regulator
MPIRVLLAQLDEALQDRLEDVLSRQPDMIVTTVDDYVEVLIAAGETQADVVVLAMENGEAPGITTHLVEEYPYLKIILVASGHQHDSFYELRQQLIPIGEASPHQLVNFIRARVHSDQDSE